MALSENYNNYETKTNIEIMNERIQETPDQFDISYYSFKNTDISVSKYSTTRKYQCSKCLKELESEELLSVHNKIHSSHLAFNSGKKLYRCEICLTTFELENDFKTHKETHKVMNI